YCGRVVFSDFHVTQSAVVPLQPFPTACKSEPMTDQEKALAFMLFDLSSCVQSDGQPPTPIQ
ncbi:MAG: carboxypeptidase regulatory-like domain-containing protein, partial [Polyangia bacterium]